MHPALLMARLAMLSLGAWLATISLATAQPDPERPVTAPDSYRVVMENDRMRMIEIHVKPRSKVTVDAPAGRDRFLYMLTDGALVLAPPGKTPYEFALHAGETAVFPVVSPTVENDTDQAVRALMVEIKTPTRAVSESRGKGKGRVAKGKSRSRVAARSSSGKASVAVKPSSGKASVTRTKSKSKQAAAKGRKAQTSSRPAPAPVNTNAPLNLRNAAAQPAPRKASGKRRGGDS